jgi:hypothetical protein
VDFSGTLADLRFLATMAVTTTTRNRKSSDKPSSGSTSNQRESASQLRGRKTKSKQKQAAGFPFWWAHLAVAFTIAFFGLIRIHLLDFPLERDEGEYAYAGQLILHGIDPYRYCYSMKLPGTASAYALLMAVFGQNAVGVHLGLLLVNSASCLLLYLVATRLFGRLTAVVSTATFALLSLQPVVLGFAGHATQFVVMPAIAGILLLLLAVDFNKHWLFFCSGFSFGLSFLMKQPGALFIVFGVFYLAYLEWTRGLEWSRSGIRLALLLLGSAIPFAGVCLLYLATGNFSRFWFWTFHYARAYEAIVPLWRGWGSFKEAISVIVSAAWPLWLISALGLIAALWRPKLPSRTVFVVGFLVFSFAAVCPGLYFRWHYFILLLPAISLLSGIAVSRATAMLRDGSVSFLATVPIILFAIALIVSTAHDSEFFFAKDLDSACHRLYGTNPFPEARRVSEFIRSRAEANDEIAVIGSEPEIYFYSRLRSATGFVYMYPLMEHQPFAITMQQEMEREVETANPRFVVFVSEAASWLRREDSESGIFDWSAKFERDHYKLIGVVDLMGDDTEFHFDDDARSYQPRSPSKMLIYQRI